MQQTIIKIPVTVVASEETWLMLGLIIESDEELINEALRNAMDLANAPLPVAFMQNVDESGVHAMTWRSQTPPNGTFMEVQVEPEPEVDQEAETRPTHDRPTPPPDLPDYDSEFDDETKVEQKPDILESEPPRKAHAADTISEDRISFLDDWVIREKQAS